MKSNPNRTLISNPAKGVLIAILLGLWFSLTTIVHFNAKLLPRPISPAYASGPEPTVITATNIFALYAQSRKTEADSIFINTIPHSDGTQVDVFVTGIEATGPVILFVDPGSGPAGHRCLDALTLDGSNAFTATIRHFAPNQDIGDGDDTMEITATVQSGLIHTGKIEFRRAFIEPTVKEDVNIDNGHFIVEMPNQHTFTNTYMMVMSTNASPGTPPAGHVLASSTYQMNASGSIFESKQVMTLKLRYQNPLPHNADPHTLSVLGWNTNNNTWLSLGGDLFSNNEQLVYVTKRLRIYALATTPIWRDTFKESILSGIATSQNIGSGPGSTLILSTGQTSGTVTSIPITPTITATDWDSLTYSVITSNLNHIRIDLLDLNDNVVLANIDNQADLSDLSVAAYPSLKLHATFTTTMVGDTPRLEEWSLGWQPTTFQPPLLTALSPLSTPNNIEAVITVTGSNFVTDTQLRLGDSYTLPTFFVSSTVITSFLAANTPAGNYNVTVTNPDGQSAILANAFSVISPAVVLLPPHIGAIWPTTATNTLTTTITVTGTHFSAEAQLRLNESYTLTTIVINTQTLQSTLLPGLPRGSYTITVINADGQIACLPNSFSVLPSIEKAGPVYLPFIIK